MSSSEKQDHSIELQKGTNLLKQDRIEDAKAIFTRILSIDKNEPNALHYMGHIFKRQGNISDALCYMESSIRRDPNNPLFKLNYGKLLSISHKYADAAKAFRESLDINPNIFETWYSYGNVLIKLRQIDDAISCFKNVITLQPQFQDAYSTLGALLGKRGSIEEAELIFNQSLILNPNHAATMINYGALLYDSGKLTQALQQYKKALKYSKNSAELHHNYAITLSRAGKLKEATESYKKNYCIEPLYKSKKLHHKNTNKFIDNQLIQSLKVPQTAEFVPSYISADIPFGMHLMYIHTPKAAGSRFATPIIQCIKKTLIEHLEATNFDLLSSVIPKDRINFLLTPRVNNIPERDGICEALKSYNLNELDLSLFVPHCISSSELQDVMKTSHGISPIKIATWREPKDRLTSHLNYLWRTLPGTEDEKSLAIEELIYSRDQILDNAIYRACFSDFSSRKIDNSKALEAKLDYLISIKDFSLLNKITSSFLSRCRLPNILVTKRYHVTPNAYKLDPDRLEKFSSLCMDEGFLAHDESTAVNDLLCKELPHEFNLDTSYSDRSLHPLTFIIDTKTNRVMNTKEYILPTAYLATREGQSFLAELFMTE